MWKFCLEWNLEANLRAFAMSLVHANFPDVARYEKYVSGVALIKFRTMFMKLKWKQIEFEIGFSCQFNNTGIPCSWHFNTMRVLLEEKFFGLSLNACMWFPEFLICYKICFYVKLTFLTSLRKKGENWSRNMSITWNSPQSLFSLK